MGDHGDTVAEFADAADRIAARLQAGAEVAIAARLFLEGLPLWLRVQMGAFHREMESLRAALERYDRLREGSAGG